jgi:hypothetical protein
MDPLSITPVLKFDGYQPPFICKNNKGRDIKFKKIETITKNIFTFLFQFVAPQGIFESLPMFTKMKAKKIQVILLNYTSYNLNLNNKKYLLINSQKLNLKCKANCHIIIYQIYNFSKIICMDVIGDKETVPEKRIFIHIINETFYQNDDAEFLVQKITEEDLFAQTPGFIVNRDGYISSNHNMKTLIENIAEEALLKPNPVLIQYLSRIINNNFAPLRTNKFTILNYTDHKITVDIMLNLRIDGNIILRLENIDQFFIFYHLQGHEDIICLETKKDKNIMCQPRLYFQLNWIKARLA